MQARLSTGGRHTLGVGLAQRLFCGWSVGFWLIGLVFSLTLSSAARAVDGPIIEKAWFEDVSAEMGIEQARASDQWRPYEGLLSQGYGPGALWVRLVIAPHLDQALILAMQPAYIDRIEIYGVTADEPLAVVGDLVHPMASERVGQAFNYGIAANEEPTELWLRLTSTSTRQLYVEVFTENQWVANQLRDQMGSVFYVVALFVLFLTALIQWQVTQDRVFAVFSLSVGTAFAYGFSVSGLLRLFWPVAWPATALDAYQSFFSVAATAAAIAFHVAFLTRLGLPRWAVVLARVYLVYQLVKFALLFWGQVILALTLNLMDVLIAPPFMLLLAILSGQSPAADRSLPRSLVIMLYALLVGFMLLAALPGLGWVAGPEFSLYVVQVNALMTTMLILAILQYRQRRLNAQSIAMEAKAVAAQQAADKERFARTEQQKLLDMLTHELKTPLAVMRLRLEEDRASSPAISKAIGDMSSMIERCSQSNQAEDGRLTVIHEAVDLDVLIRDVIERVAGGRSVMFESMTDTTTDIATSPISRTDPHLLSIVLTNLIENACKYSAPESEIKLSLEPDQSAGYVFGIENVPGEAGWPDADQVFDKYYRSNHAKRQSGTGLGLFLAQSLTQLLSGRLDYAPTDSRIRFVLWIPSQP